MLTKPEHGWTDFQLEGTSIYGLSYLDDIAFEWLDQAVHGLETMYPFCVKGFLEPGRMLCTVSYWNCHIILEDEMRDFPNNGAIQHEVSHTSMIDFCRFLYHDISQFVDAWVSFADYYEIDVKKNRKRLLQKLDQLNALIAKREDCFRENNCFL